KLDPPFALARHQQQRPAAFLRAVPAMEQLVLVHAVGIVDRFTLTALLEPARQQRSSRTRWPRQYGSAKRPGDGIGKGIDHRSIGVADDDPRRALAPGGGKWKSDLPHGLPARLAADPQRIGAHRD